MLVNRGKDRWPSPEVRFYRPARPSIRVERKGNLYPAATRTAHASPLLNAVIDDKPQLARRHGSLARVLRDRKNEQVIPQPPKSA